MTEYPTEWEVVELGSCLNRIEAGSSPDLPDRPAGPGEWGVLKVSAVRPTGFDASENKVVTNRALVDTQVEVRDGDLLITRANTPQLVGLVCYVQNPPERLLLCDKTLRLITDERKLVSKFAGYALTMPSIRKQIEVSGTGSSGSMKNISQADIRSLQIALPSVGEQKRIVAAFGSIDESIRSKVHLIEKLIQARQGLIDQLLVDDSDSRTTIGVTVDLAGSFIQTGPFGSQLHASDYVNNGVPVVMPQDISDGVILSDRISSVSENTAQRLSRHRMRVGDIVFARRGDLSKCAVVLAGQDGWLCGTGCLLLRPPSEVSSDWLSLVYRHDICQRQIDKVAVGSTMVNLNTTIVANLEIPRCSREDQDKIVRQIKLENARVDAARLETGKLEAIKLGLMVDLLTGRVRVRC